MSIGDPFFFLLSKVCYSFDILGVIYHIVKFPTFLTVENLASRGAKMVIISNSSRRASTTLDKLKSLGFDPSLFIGAITSGELTYQHLQR